MRPEMLADLILLLARLEQRGAGAGQRRAAVLLRARYASVLA